MAKSQRGFAKMPRSRVQEIARSGGNNSPTKFKPGDPRAVSAGRKGGQARAKSADVTSGRLGRMGATARWGDSTDMGEYN